jgi:hypothetical protein
MQTVTPHIVVRDAGGGGEGGEEERLAPSWEIAFPCPVAATCRSSSSSGTRT